MNNNFRRSTHIQTYDELMNEKQRLEGLIAQQKNLIRHDVEELKSEFKKELKPAVDAGNFVKKLARPTTRKQTLFTLGARLALDLLIRRTFRGSNLLIQAIIPPLIRNYSSHLVGNLSQRLNTYHKINGQNKQLPSTNDD